MNLVNALTLCVFLFSPPYHAQKSIAPFRPKRRFPTIATRTTPMGCAHFLAKALYGMNLCLQQKYGQVGFPFGGENFPSLKSKPLLYYPMIMDRVINRKPIILPQTFQQMSKALGYLTEIRDYFKKKLNTGNATFGLMPLADTGVSCRQKLLNCLRAFQKSQLYRRLKVLAGIFIPVYVLKMACERQMAREEAMCGNVTEFIRRAQSVFYRTVSHPQHQHRSQHHHCHCHCYCHHHYHRHHRHN